MSVYSIYKETHSSDGSAMPERHYAGWAADRDEAILRANELYEGRDSTEAALVKASRGHLSEPMSSATAVSF